MSCVVKRIIVEFAKIDVFTDWRVVRRMQFDVVQNFLHNILQFQNFCVFKQIIVEFAKNCHFRGDNAILCNFFAQDFCKILIFCWCLERCVVNRVVDEFAKISCVAERIIVEFAKIDVFTDRHAVRRMQFADFPKCLMASCLCKIFSQHRIVVEFDKKVITRNE